jgi:ComF family protein
MPTTLSVRSPARWAPRWPSQCLVCRTWQSDALCAPCVQRFGAARKRCLQCAVPLPGGSELCGACVREPPPQARTIAALDYGFPWDRLVAGLKFRGRIEYAAPLAALLARAVAAADGATNGGAPNLVACVPLSATRQRERGHNQAFELARRAAHELGLPALPDALVRVRDAPAQTALTRVQRLANLRGAFVPSPQARSLVQGQHVALVDDVMTTGATAAEAAATLLRAGARQVSVWVLARTLPSQDA